MTNDIESIRIILARCMGTLEGLQQLFRMPVHVDQQVRRLIADIGKAANLTGDVAIDDLDHDREDAIFAEGYRKGVFAGSEYTSFKSEVDAHRKWVEGGRKTHLDLPGVRDG